MKKQLSLSIFLLAVAGFLFVSALPVHAEQYIVYPNDPYWNLETRGSKGNAYISGEKPRGGQYTDLLGNVTQSNASLKLTLPESQTPLNNWAFYARYAGDIAGDSWGLLSDISAIAFDWYRATDTDDNYLDYDPWNLQTPVLRLLIRDTVETATYYSELVWEKYYTDNNPNNMTIGEWVYEDLHDQNYWRYITDEGYTISDGTIMEDFGTNTLMAISLNSWAYYDANDPHRALPYSEEAVIYGLSVGVGSAWPGPYTGYVDNIYLAFGENESFFNPINDNFELPVPEPATMLLLGSGLALLGIGRRWRGKRK